MAPAVASDGAEPPCTLSDWRQPCRSCAGQGVGLCCTIPGQDVGHSQTLHRPFQNAWCYLLDNCTPLFGADRVKVEARVSSNKGESKSCSFSVRPL